MLTAFIELSPLVLISKCFLQQKLWESIVVHSFFQLLYDQYSADYWTIIFWFIQQAVKYIWKVDYQCQYHIIHEDYFFSRHESAITFFCTIMQFFSMDCKHKILFQPFQFEKKNTPRNFNCIQQKEGRPSKIYLLRSSIVFYLIHAKTFQK